MPQIALRLPLPCGGLSQPPGALADRFRRRRAGRYGCAHPEPVAVGSPRPAIRGREPHRLRRQHRGRRHHFAARRLHPAVRRTQQRDLDLALQEAAVRFHPRHRAGRQHHAAHQHAGGVEPDAGEDRRGVHRLLQGQPRARFPTRHRAMAPRCICRPNCSRR